MTTQELYYRLALCRVNGIGPIKSKKLIGFFGSAKEIFAHKQRALRKSGLCTDIDAAAISTFNDFGSIDQELQYCDKNGIRILDYDDEFYPQRLKACVDSPLLLFFKGQADINPPRILSVIGTRSFSDYGRKICEELIEQLKPFGVLVVSGLAYGIDVIAHKACLKNNMATVGVLAHGLHTVYPYAHKTIAADMLQQGGLLSEYFSKSKPDRGNFPSRNRIVAGMADATVVIETDIRGGSMITADLAFSYNRDVFCFPGRSIDPKSAGCNLLIKKLRAQLVTSAEDIAMELGWKQITRPKPVQKELFMELNSEEQHIVAALREKATMHVDELLSLTGLNSSQIAMGLLNLEMKDLVRVVPGKMISLC